MGPAITRPPRIDPVSGKDEKVSKDDHRGVDEKMIHVCAVKYLLPLDSQDNEFLFSSGVFDGTLHLFPRHNDRNAGKGKSS
jgi:hypothetical protein